MRASVSFAAYVVCTLISGAAQDMLYTSSKFNETDAMSLVQSLLLFVLGAVSYGLRQSKVVSACQPPVLSSKALALESDAAGSRRMCCGSVPPSIQLALGVSIAANVLLTNYATEFLSFPVQVVFKSSKLLVAMAVRALVFRKPNLRVDYQCGVVLSLGLVAFMWPSHSSSSVTNAGSSTFAIGLVCVLGSLLAEAVMLNVQEHYLLQKYEVSTEWVMMYGYLYSTMSQVALLVLVGTFGHTVQVLTNLSSEVALLLFVFPFFMWVGVTFLLFLVKDHGAVAASAANVVRKVIAIAFSFVYFGREVTVPIALGAVLVFGAIVARSMVGGHGHTHVKEKDSEQDVSSKASGTPVDDILSEISSVGLSRTKKYGDESDSNPS